MSLWEKQEGLCAVTGIPMEIKSGSVNNRNRNKFSIDRKDSSKGYTRENVWLVLEWVNRAKQDLTKEQLVKFAHGILENLW